MPETLMEEWDEEYETKFRLFKALKELEEDFKQKMKEHYKSYRFSKREFGKYGRMRKAKQKELKNFWTKKKGLMYRHRIWAKENVGKAIDNLKEGI
jgi:hypothetical protein